MRQAVIDSDTALNTSARQADDVSQALAAASAAQATRQRSAEMNTALNEQNLAVQQIADDMQRIAGQAKPARRGARQRRRRPRTGVALAVELRGRWGASRRNHHAVQPPAQRDWPPTARGAPSSLPF